MSIGHNNSYFIVKKETETIVIRLLEGEFPKYGDITAKTGGHDILLDKTKFVKMLKRMSILSSENYKGAIFNFKENKLVITASNPDIGEAKEDMGIEYNGDDVEVAVAVCQPIQAEVLVSRMQRHAEDQPAGDHVAPEALRRFAFDGPHVERRADPSHEAGLRALDGDAVTGRVNAGRV